MSNELKSVLEIVHNLKTQTELALLIEAASKRIIELSVDDEAFVFTEELKNKIAAIEARHAKGEGKTYTKVEFREHLDKLMAS